MSRDHWISVKVTHANGKYTFEPDCEELYSNGRFVFDKTSLNMGKSESHMLKFVLDDRTGHGLKFKEFPDDAMWVKQIPDIDPKHCAGARDKDYSVLKPLNVIDNRTRLIVRNTNPDDRKWAFTLNFEGTKGPVSWDPIGDNQDGGHNLISSNWLTYTAIAIGAGFVSAIVTTAAFLGLRLL